jgi:two-component system alkaline phosphatase synthesis response regulator PhoP
VRILIVDDHADILLMLQHLLAKSEHEITLAQDSRNALTIIQHIEFDALIVDLMMPHLSGPDLIRKARLAKPNLRIIAMTGGNPSKFDVIGPDGANTLLLKPFSRAALFEVLAE